MWSKLRCSINLCLGDLDSCFTFHDHVIHFVGDFLWMLERLLSVISDMIPMIGALFHSGECGQFVFLVAATFFRTIFNLHIAVMLTMINTETKISRNLLYDPTIFQVFTRGESGQFLSFMLQHFPVMPQHLNYVAQHLTHCRNVNNN